MLIGNGMVARAFTRYREDDQVVLFASGVSHSGETDPRNFKREEDLLKKVIRENSGKLLVYFSTCSIEDKDICETPYVQHKLKMENLILQHHSTFLIFRLPQLLGESKNRTTLVNFFYDRIQTGASFNLWKNAVRYLIDITDAVKIVSYIIDHQILRDRIINVALRSYRVLEIVQLLEKIMDKRANYTFQERGAFFEIDCSEIALIIQKLGIPSDRDYLERALVKYYSKG